jgi:hypothetical protein
MLAKASEYIDLQTCTCNDYVDILTIHLDDAGCESCVSLFIDRASARSRLVPDLAPQSCLPQSLSLRFSLPLSPVSFCCPPMSSQTGSTGKTLEQAASNAVFRKLRLQPDNKVKTGRRNRQAESREGRDGPDRGRGCGSLCDHSSPVVLQQPPPSVSDFEQQHSTFSTPRVLDAELACSRRLDRCSVAHQQSCSSLCGSLPSLSTLTPSGSDVSIVRPRIRRGPACRSVSSSASVRNTADRLNDVD